MPWFLFSLFVVRYEGFERQQTSHGSWRVLCISIKFQHEEFEISNEVKVLLGFDSSMLGGSKHIFSQMVVEWWFTLIDSKKSHTWQFFVTFLGWLVKCLFKRLSDLQLGDKKVTSSHPVHKSKVSSTLKWSISRCLPFLSYSGSAKLPWFSHTQYQCSETLGIFMT